MGQQAFFILYFFLSDESENPLSGSVNRRIQWACPYRSFTFDLCCFTEPCYMSHNGTDTDGCGSSTDNPCFCSQRNSSVLYVVTGGGTVIFVVLLLFTYHKWVLVRWLVYKYTGKLIGGDKHIQDLSGIEYDAFLSYRYSATLYRAMSC